MSAGAAKEDFISSKYIDYFSFKLAYYTVGLKLKFSLLFQKLGLSLLSVIDLPLKYNISRSSLIIFIFFK